MIKEYNYLKQKFGLQPSSDCRWRFLRLRPGKFSTYPHRTACLPVPSFTGLILTTDGSRIGERITESPERWNIGILADTLHFWYTFSFSSQNHQPKLNRFTYHQYGNTISLCLRQAQVERRLMPACDQTARGTEARKQLHHPYVERMWTRSITCRRQSGTYPARKRITVTWRNACTAASDMSISSKKEI